MSTVLLVLSIIVLLFYLFVTIDTIILYKKNDGRRIKDIREVLIKRINLAMILTVVLAALIIARILINK